LDEELAVRVADGPDGAVVALRGPLSPRTIPQISGGLGRVAAAMARARKN
jgi:hypothetical protein